MARLKLPYKDFLESYGLSGVCTLVSLPSLAIHKLSQASFYMPFQMSFARQKVLLLEKDLRMDALSLQGCRDLDA